MIRLTVLLAESTGFFWQVGSNLGRKEQLNGTFMLLSDPLNA